MTVTTLSSRELNHDVTRAKTAAKSGPVIITDRGKPSHVLLSIEEYQRITNKHRSIGDALGCVESAYIEFDAPKVSLGVREVDFS